MSLNPIKVALIGNPNVGKTSVFNALTGLNQQVGNYPGITVEKKQGSAKLSDDVKAKIIDLPGTYSLNASSIDENVVIDGGIDLRVLPKKFFPLFHHFLSRGRTISRDKTKTMQ